MPKWTEEDLEAKMKENSQLKIENDGPMSGTKSAKQPKISLEMADQSNNKYHAIKTWSELCQRMFDSKAEARRGEELCLLEKAEEIRDLRYQVPFVLCEKPRIKITLDFAYLDQQPYSLMTRWDRVYEDVKGILTREFRVKLAWLQEKYKIDVSLIK